MAAFIAMTSWRGEFADEYFVQSAADPAQFGMPTEDDGSRDDPLLSDRSWAVSSYRPDVDALAAASTRVVIAVGEESLGKHRRGTTGRGHRARRPCLGDAGRRLRRRVGATTRVVLQRLCPARARASSSAAE